VRGEIEDPIIAACVLAPDCLGMRENQKLLPVGGEGIAFDRQRLIVAGGNYARSCYENFAGAGNSLIADDAGAAWRGGRVTGGGSVTVGKPLSAAKCFGPEFGIEPGAGEEVSGRFGLGGKAGVG